MDLSTVRFGRGAHKKTKGETPTGDRDLCIMEAVAFFAGEPWTDEPACACPVIADFLRSWNDGLSEPDRDRLLPATVWIPRLINSRGDRNTTNGRQVFLYDWFARTYMPVWLELVPELAHHAKEWRATPEITNYEQLRAVNEIDRRIDALTVEADALLSSIEHESVNSRSSDWLAAALAIQAASGRVNEIRIWDIVFATARIAARRGVSLLPIIPPLQQGSLELLERLLTYSGGERAERAE